MQQLASVNAIKIIIGNQIKQYLYIIKLNYGAFDILSFFFNELQLREYTNYLRIKIGKKNSYSVLQYYIKLSTLTFYES